MNIRAEPHTDTLQYTYDEKCVAEHLLKRIRHRTQGELE